MRHRNLVKQARKSLGRTSKATVKRAITAINSTRLPPIHDISHCYPGKHGERIYFSAFSAPMPLHWPTDEDIKAGLAYWDAVFADKGTKPLS